jgi:hypothetical protein
LPPGLIELALGLIECCLEGPRIDFEENLSLRDLTAFPVVLPYQITARLRLDLCVYISVEGSDPLTRERHVGRLDSNNGDWHRLRGSGKGGLLFAATAIIEPAAFLAAGSMTLTGHGAPMSPTNSG